MSFASDKVTTNPVVKFINLGADSSDKITGYELYNYTGQVMLFEKTGAIAKGKCTINIAPLVPGLYTLKVKTDQGNFIQKVDVIK
ncbi:MAG: T9SS type A sorting domain-containing protein [Bacteroidia bacterium]